MSDLPHIAVVGGGISVAVFGELPAAIGWLGVAGPPPVGLARLGAGSGPPHLAGGMAADFRWPASVTARLRCARLAA
ncbi:MAG TPA: hypothetical protein VII53_04035 [Solirubrobacteraceae bacterium]